MKIPEKIYLIDIDGDKNIDSYIWADEPCPEPEMDEKDAIIYVKLSRVKKLLKQCIKKPIGVVPDDVMKILKEGV